MRSAGDVHGEILKYVGVLSLAVASIFVSYFFPTHSVSRFLGIEGVPCLGLGLLCGLLYVFWIALAREIYGKGWGTVVSALTVSILLLNGPWYGIVNPPYFGLFGFASFIAMGLITDFINGGFGGVVCLLINWLAFLAFKGIYAPPFMAVIVLIGTFISGFSFDLLAKKVAGLLGKKI